VVVRRLGDHCGEPLATGLDQHVRVGEAFQHGQIGGAEIPGGRGHRQQLADQVLDSPLVQRPLLGEPVRGLHPPVRRRSLGAGQLEGLQTGRVEQQQAGQGVGVDAVGRGVPGCGQVSSFGQRTCRCTAATPPSSSAFTRR
jgi:hypothetical protein